MTITNLEAEITHLSRELEHLAAKANGVEGISTKYRALLVNRIRSATADLDLCFRLIDNAKAEHPMKSFAWNEL